MSKALTVKDLAAKYGVSSNLIAAELVRQGVKVDKGEKTKIPEDMTDLIESFFDDLYGQHDDEALVGKGGKRSGAQKKSGARKEENAPRSASSRKGEGAQDSGKGASAGSGKKVILSSPIVVKALAEAIGRKPNEVLTDLIKLGELSGINKSVSDANAKKICAAAGFELVIGAPPKAEAPAAEEPVRKVDESKLVPRPPVVTFMGHVDHGKTSLQDAIRHTNVTAGEAGAITQHIGASTVEFEGRPITFIDTPGHAAFTSMRARGANVTDIVVLVVSAAEGFKPQTVEAMNHALAADVPIIVAANKMDLPGANYDQVLLNMQQNNLTSEDWGGKVGVVKVSAKTGAGLPDLLERILVEADMLELKADPTCPAEGVVLEAQLEQGLGPTSHVLVKNGTLRTGDPILCGTCWGKARMLIDDKGRKVREVKPGFPVKVVGLSGVPEAGDKLTVVGSEKEARLEAERRNEEKRAQQLATTGITTADDLFNKLNSEGQRTLNIIIKSDVKGSGEAIAQSLLELPSEKIKAEVIANAVGPICDNDIELAAATNALVVGFHVHVNPGVNDLAAKRHVEIRLYTIIYELLEDITAALAGKLEPEKRETVIGRARILQIFELSKGPKICGCRVESGLVRVGAKARVRRSKELIYNGEVISLRHLKEDMREVKAGFDCGIRLDNFADFMEGDEIEFYTIELKKATL
ncbi:MAG: translation initiation factor IF-2 [Lentisphaeria bacterium]|nr:translation initiation factor IF-2 [Lentisphaeria bacterium]